MIQTNPASLQYFLWALTCASNWSQYFWTLKVNSTRKALTISPVTAADTSYDSSWDGQNLDGEPLEEAPSGSDAWSWFTDLRPTHLDEEVWDESWAEGDESWAETFEPKQTESSLPPSDPSSGALMEVDAAASEAPAEVQPATAAPLSAEEPRPFKIGTLWNVLEDRQMSFTTQEDTVKTNSCDNWSVQVEDVKTGNLWSLFCQRVARKSLMRKAAATHGNEKRVSWADEKKEREIKYGAVTKEGVQDFLANAYRDTAEVSEAADVHTEEVAGPSCSQPQHDSLAGAVSPTPKALAKAQLLDSLWEKPSGNDPTTWNASRT